MGFDGRADGEGGRAHSPNDEEAIIVDTREDPILTYLLTYLLTYSPNDEEAIIADTREDLMRIGRPAD